MGIERSSTLDQKIDHAGIAIVQHAEPSGPPFGSLPYVRPGAEQHVDRGAIAPLYRCEQRMLAETIIGQRIVDFPSQFGMPFEDLANTRGVAIAHSEAPCSTPIPLRGWA